MKLFCLTYAGGSASFYDLLDKYISPDIQLIKLEYAGHGARSKEPLYSSFEELAEDMYGLITSQVTCDEEYALIGYSMGSISVTEILKKILAEGKLKKPKQVFLAAHEPQTKAELANYSDGELDEKVKQRTIQFGDLPDNLINNKIFWRMYLPIYRADYSIIGKYRFEELKLVTDVPALVFYSEEDTLYEDMKKWTYIFASKCEYARYSGKHFFIREHAEEMAIEINKRLTE